MGDIEGGGGGGSVLIFLLELSHLTVDHASRSGRSGTAFLLLIETPPTFERSIRFFHILRITFFFLLVLFPSSLAVCGHHLSRRIAIVFSLLSNVPNFSIGGCDEGVAMVGDFFYTDTEQRKLHAKQSEIRGKRMPMAFTSLRFYS